MKLILQCFDASYRKLQAAVLQNMRIISSTVRRTGKEQQQCWEFDALHKKKIIIIMKKNIFLFIFLVLVVIIYQLFFIMVDVNVAK